jgi:hypothetical protein
MKRHTDLNGEPIGWIGLEIVKIGEGMEEIGQSSIDHEGIVDCMHGIVGLLETDSLNGRIYGYKESHVETGIYKCIEHPYS